MVTMDLDREDAVQVSVSSPIDELRYSRLIYTLGMDAMQNLQRIRVLIVGCKGLGAEIAKNLLLSGIASVGLMDNENVCLADLGSNFCLRESDVGFNRAATVAGALHELRPSGDVHVVTEPSIEAVLSHYDVVAATVGTLPDLNRLNLLCRAARIPFIATRSIGLLSFVFADLGEAYVFKDENIEQSFLLLVANITQDDPATVTIVEDQRLDLRNGDEAVDECIRVGRGNAMGSGVLSLEEAEYEKIVARGKEIWQSSSFLSSEVWLCDRKGQKQRCEAMPATEVCSSADANAGRPREIKFNTIGSFNEKLMKALAQTIDAELCPLIAVTGGFAAQEVIKASGKVFTPLHQWIYFDAVDCMPSDFQIALVKHPVESRYDQQIALFGRDFQQILGSLKWLVVGAGSIGCEVLKNLVLMGVGCNSNGSIMITDMDCISKPNHSNQILYRMEDLGKEKAPTAGRALQKINPEAQIHTVQENFDAETESIFDSTFLQSISGVFSAVDTASSRLYIDMRCVTFRKPMIDGGKHGAKGSVQVFIPFQSEMYASTRDPPEFKETPICTLRNCPYTTEHTLHWSVETFDSLFKPRPSDVNAYLSNRDFQDSLKKTNPSARLPILETLCDALSRHKPLSFAACIQWARLQFEDLFSNNIKQLSFNFPEDMVTTTGAPFWSGTKRSPVPITFNVMDPLHYCFIVAAANLQATVYGLKGCQDRGLFFDVLQNTDVPVFQPKEGVRIATSDADIRSGGQQKGSFMTTDDNGAAQNLKRMMSGTSI